MRTIPPGIAAAMADGATTLCRCWIVRRTDGVRLGFTDHDAALAVEGVACQPESGLDGTEADASLGFSVGGGEITGVLTSDAIAEADIAKGLWDNAAVETWLVDWSNPAERILLASGTIGEIRRQDHAFSAELRGPAHALDQPAGRLFQASCSADLGDARCRVNLEQAALKATLPVDSAGGRDLGIAAGLAPYPDGLFAGGTLVFETGANAGARLEIRNDSRLGDAGLLSLWQAPPRPAAIGDTVTIRAGCDKQLTTCRNRFNNLVNFRGFARMPGNDFVLGYPPIADWRDGDGHLDKVAGADSALDPSYLLGGVRSGEAFDWFYASAADRKAQRRTPITDGAYGKPWVFRQKDLAGWWLNGHVERAGGVELGVATAWQPGSKPIWLTETGFPAVDRGPNGPNVFPDPKSSESAYPAFSHGVRDDLAQSRGIEATLRCFDPAQAGHPVGANPVSPVTGLRMVDSARTHIWAWDARPFPAFPQAVDVWGDGANWSTGHWLNGRLEGVPLDVLVREIAADLGGVEVDASALEGFVDGYVLDRTLSARGALEPLAALWGFDAVASGSVLRFQRRDRLSALTLGPDDLVAEKERPLLTLTRAQETELPREISIAFGDGDNAYASAVASSRRVEGPAVRASRNEAGLVSRRGPMQRLADRALQDAWTGRETLETVLRPGLVALEIGDVVSVEVDGAPRTFRITRLSDGNARKLEARAVERPAEAQVAEIAAAPRYASPPVAGPPHALIVDLPATRSEPPVLQWLAAAANPWPGGLTLWRSADGASFEPLTRMDAPAVVGELLAPFPAGPLWCWDDAAVLSLRLSGGHLATVTDLAALDAAAPLAVQGPDGAWEIVSFARATLTGDRQWTLRRLLRGLGGSEAAAGRAAPAGSPVVLVDPSLVPLATGSDALNRPWLYRLAPAGLDVSAPQALAFAATPGPAALRPLSPVRAAARRDGGGVRLSWIRRTRLGGDNWEQAEVPLSEENEAYEVDVLGGGVVKRTLSTTAPQALYAAADELADFGAAQSTLSVRIAQLGASVGRGAVLEATLPVG